MEINNKETNQTKTTKEERQGESVMKKIERNRKQAKEEEVEMFKKIEEKYEEEVESMEFKGLNEFKEYDRKAKTFKKLGLIEDKNNDIKPNYEKFENYDYKVHKNNNNNNMIEEIENIDLLINKVITKIKEEYKTIGFYIYKYLEDLKIMKEGKIEELIENNKEETEEEKKAREWDEFVAEINEERKEEDERVKKEKEAGTYKGNDTNILNNWEDSEIMKKIERNRKQAKEEEVEYIENIKNKQIRFPGLEEVRDNGIKIEKIKKEKENKQKMEKNNKYIDIDKIIREEEKKQINGLNDKENELMDEYKKINKLIELLTKQLQEEYAESDYYIYDYLRNLENDKIKIIKELKEEKKRKRTVGNLINNFIKNYN
jgi:hypothetical protein